MVVVDFGKSMDLLALSYSSFFYKRGIMKFSTSFKRICFFILFSIILVSDACMGKSKKSYNVDTDTSYSNGFVQYADDLTEYSEKLTEYAGDLTLYEEDLSEYSESLTSYADDLTYLYFGEYVDGVYSVQLKSQKYIKAYLEINGVHSIDIGKVIAKLCVGTGTIIITAFVLPALPVIAGTSAAAGYAAQVCVVAVKIANEAVLGAAMDAAISGTLKYYETNGDVEQTFYSAIEQSSDGFMWGAVISSGMETIKEVKFLHQAVKEKKLVSKAFKCETKNVSKACSAKDISHAVEKNTNDLVSVLNKTPKNKKELVYRFFASYPDDAAELYAKYKDDILKIFEKVGEKFRDKLLQILKYKNGDDVIKALLIALEKNPKKISLVIDYIKAKGLDGAYDVLKWNGYIPSWLTKDVVNCAEKISGSSLKAMAEELKKLPAIRLTTKELDMIRQNPAVLKDIVFNYTGKNFKDGYLEFFVRLANKNPRQLEEIWNYSKAVRDFIKNNGIRPGGAHEWLMCENFCDFLTNPKWRKDGAYLCEVLSKLTQSNDTVVMENVNITLKDGRKYKVWTHLLESQNTMGSALNPNSLIHNNIREVIKNSNSVEDLLVNLEKMVKQNFSEETYNKFLEALVNCYK